MESAKTSLSTACRDFERLLVGKEVPLWAGLCVYRGQEAIYETPEAERVTVGITCRIEGDLILLDPAFDLSFPVPKSGRCEIQLYTAEGDFVFASLFEAEMSPGITVMLKSRRS